MNLTPMQKEVILALADCGMKKFAAAKKMFVHYNTIEYHVYQIIRKTGKDPRKFYDLLDLVQMVKGETDNG